MNNEKLIKVSRYRDGEYVVNYDINGRLMSYKWAGSQGNKIDTKSIPEHVVDWLVMSTSAIRNGSLVIEKDDNSAEIINNIGYEDEKKNVVHTRAEVERILNGNTNSMKSKLAKIENKSEKDFIINVAQEMKIDSMAKREFLAEWMGVSVEMLFQNEE